ncbi:MAG: malto-oligosyltrehalose trehalohydrolase [Pseudomonadota bacterium]
MEIGAIYWSNGRCEFIVWAPLLKEISLHIVYPTTHTIPLEKDNDGYWKVIVNDVYSGAQYFYLLENSLPHPDPASFSQPEGVHGLSEVVDHRSFLWEDYSWPGIPLEKMVIYEIHTGTFTPPGTFKEIIPRLNDLQHLGINTIELMPVAQFPGERNWGYDGAYLFAVQNSYGGPEGLKELVNACHQKGFSVILDVVYNHLGPEGNYLAEFGPYFTEKYKSPWGKAINYDGAYSDGVRNFFIQNALYWFRHYHLDGLRLDAIHGIYDINAKHILEELAEEVETFSKRQGRKFYLIAESDLNNPRIIRAKKSGGFGIDAQWCDDFHHSLHTLLTGEKVGYYEDFGKINDLKKSFEEGFVLSGQYSKYRKRRHGAYSKNISPRQLVVFSQNHDQVGNRMFGERLSTLVNFESLKLAAGTMLISPYIPLLFMGEEYGEESPFLYFVHHSDPDLIRAVQEGRKKEFQSFRWKGEPPDPQSIETFLASKLKWEKRLEEWHHILLNFYRQLIKLKKEIPALGTQSERCLSVSVLEEKNLLFVERRYLESMIFVILNFNTEDTITEIRDSQGRWRKLLDSSEPQWMGPGSHLPEKIERPVPVTIRPRSFAVFEREGSL